MGEHGLADELDDETRGALCGGSLAAADVGETHSVQLRRTPSADFCLMEV